MPPVRETDETPGGLRPTKSSQDQSQVKKTSQQEVKETSEPDKMLDNLQARQSSTSWGNTKR